MGIFSKIARSVVYRCTEKPTHYVHVDKPKTMQEHRQVQYNNWCKAKGVYNGSYLPKNPDTLLRKGWTESTHVNNISGKRHFSRKSFGQIVRFDPENNNQIDHYHWHNPSPTKTGHKVKTEYLDRFGQPCTKYDDQHHLAPLDKDCPPKARKR